MIVIYGAMSRSDLVFEEVEGLIVYDLDLDLDFKSWVNLHIPLLNENSLSSMCGSFS